MRLFTEKMMLGDFPISSRIIFIILIIAITLAACVDNGKTGITVSDNNTVLESELRSDLNTVRSNLSYKPNTLTFDNIAAGVMCALLPQSVSISWEEPKYGKFILFDDTKDGKDLCFISSGRVLSESVVITVKNADGTDYPGSGLVTIDVTDTYNTSSGGENTDTTLAKYMIVVTTQEQVDSLNATVLLDGLPVGSLDKTGHFQGETTAGDHVITVSDKLLGIARRELSLIAGENPDIQMEIAVGSELTEPLTILVEDASEGVLHGVPTDLHLSLKNAQGKPISLESMNAYIDTDNTSVLGTTNISGLDLVDNGGAVLDSNGTLVEVPNFANILNQLANNFSELKITLDGQDATGIKYGGEVKFRVGAVNITGQLQAPPSTPSLVLANRTLQLALLGTEIIETTSSDENGFFQFKNVASGIYDVKMAFSVGKLEYSTFGTVLIQDDTTLTVTPLTGIDYENGVESVSASATALEMKSWDISARTLSAQQNVSNLPSKSLSENSVTVSAGAQNAPITATKKYSIPKGTTKATLRYLVKTEEYPVYVLSNSQFNDKWSVSAVAATTGKKLFAISQRVNSQVSTAPTWKSTGDTGEIEQELKIGDLTKDDAIEIVVTVQSTNIGDSALTTTVTAEVAPPSPLKVQSLKLIQPSFDTDQTTDVLSIPDSGQSGLNVKKATVSITNAAGQPVTPKSAKLELISSNGSVIGALPNPTFTASGNVFQFNVALGNSLNGASATERGSLKLTVKATVDGKEEEGEGESALLLLLRKMPSGTLSRTGSRDAGGDEWSHAKTVNWMSTNAASLTKFDDISGEHGRDIGHQTHRKGTDIDMLQFGTSANSGTIAYQNLLANVRIAVDQKKQEEVRNTAIASVAAYFQAQRNGINAVLNLPNVAHVITLDDNGESDLVAHWGKIALREGVLKTKDGTEVDLGIGTYSPTKEVKHLKQHHHHNHVTLSF